MQNSALYKKNKLLFIYIFRVEIQLKMKERDEKKAKYISRQLSIIGLNRSAKGRI